MITRHRSEALTQTCMFCLHVGISIPAHRGLLLCYNQQLSKSQTHKQSFVLLHLFFSPRWVKMEKKKKKSIQTRLGIQSRPTVDSLFHCAANAHRLVVTLSVCSRSNAQVHLVTWADDSSAITDIFKSYFSLEKLLWNNDLRDQTPAPPLYSVRTISLSLFGCFFHFFLSLSQFLRWTAQLSALYGRLGRQVGGAFPVMTPSPTHSVFWLLQGRIIKLFLFLSQAKSLTRKTKNQ